MPIQEDILHSAGAVREHFNAGDYIFREGDRPLYYYQILIGNVKLNRYIDGKEFIQDELSDNHSIGEAMLILGKAYPLNAVALSDCTVLKISTEHFFHLLHLHPHIFLDIYSALADASFENAVMMDSITSKSME